MKAVELAFTVDATEGSGRCPTSDKTCKKELSPDVLLNSEDFQAISESLRLSD